MKIRTGFVSNSSSSSFICDVCDSEHSGMDASLEEACMMVCENGHTICTEHLLGEIEIEEIKKIVIKRYESYKNEYVIIVKTYPYSDDYLFSEYEKSNKVRIRIYPLGGK